MFGRLMAGGAGAHCSIGSVRWQDVPEEHKDRDEKREKDRDRSRDRRRRSRSRSGALGVSVGDAARWPQPLTAALKRMSHRQTLK